MTQDEIIRMAREAGLPVDDSLGFPLAHLNESTIFAFNLWIGRFAALVAAHEKKFWMEQIEVECNEAVLAEREACAKVCEAEIEEGEAPWTACDYAAAIRARSN